MREICSLKHAPMIVEGLQAMEGRAMTIVILGGYTDERVVSHINIALVLCKLTQIMKLVFFYLHLKKYQQNQK